MVSLVIQNASFDISVRKKSWEYSKGLTRKVQIQISKGKFIKKLMAKYEVVMVSAACFVALNKTTYAKPVI